MRDIDIGSHGRMIAIVDKAYHVVYRIEQREVKRFEFEGDLHAQIRGIVSRGRDRFERELPLLGRRNYFLIPNIFPNTRSTIVSLVFVGQVEVRLHAFPVELANALVEIDQAEGDAGDRHDRQRQSVAFVLDQPPLAHIDFERVGENIDRIEADFLGLLQTEHDRPICLHPGRVDESEFHGRLFHFAKKSGRPHCSGTTRSILLGGTNANKRVPQSFGP